MFVWLVFRVHESGWDVRHMDSLDEEFLKAFDSEEKAKKYAEIIAGKEAYENISCVVLDEWGSLPDVDSTELRHHVEYLSWRKIKVE